MLEASINIGWRLPLRGNAALVAALPELSRCPHHTVQVHARFSPDVSDVQWRVTSVEPHCAFMTRTFTTLSSNPFHSGSPGAKRARR